jgi:hypothetical protein
MTESDNKPELLVPYFVSFEGRMPAQKLAEVVAMLGGMSAEMQVSLRMGTPEVNPVSEEVTNIAVGRNDFFRVAEHNEISKVLAGRTVGILQRLADKNPYWREIILLPQGGYSSKALKEANLRGDLLAINGMGTKGCELVELVIADVEAQNSVTANEQTTL